MNQTSKPIIALDVGTKRIGIAISDTSHSFAFPRGFIERKDCIKSIVSLAYKEDIEMILVGMPYLPSGEKGTQAKDTEQFIQELSENIKIQIKTVDERMSTQEAIKKSEDVPHISKRIKRDKGALDSYAATIILQNYLNYIKS